MTKHAWRSIGNHIDPEKEEQLKWLKIGKKTETLQTHWRIWDSALRPKRTVFKACLPAQCYPERGYLWYTEWQLIRKIENQVKRVIKLTKNINHGNKERNLKNKSEAIHLVEEFQMQYDSLYALYEDLRDQVKKNIGAVDENNSPSSASNSDSESYYSPGGSNTTRTHIKSSSTSKDSDSSNSDNQEPETTSDLEDTILKDKLTCSSEVKKIMTNLDSQSESGEILKDLRVEDEDSENIKIKDLEGQVESLKLEVSTLCMEKSELKEQVECKSDEAMQLKDKISRLEARVSEIEAESKEKERRFYSVKQMEDNEQKYVFQISDLVAQANDMKRELDILRNQKRELEGRFSNETEKSSSQIKGLTEQVNSLKNEMAVVNSQKAEMKSELEKKSTETSKCLIQIENLKKEWSLKEQRLAEENKDLKAQVNDSELKIRSLLSTKSELEEHVRKIDVENETLRKNISELQTSLSKKENEVSTEQKKIIVENETLRRKISELQTSLSKRESELSTERKKFTATQNIIAEEVKNLENKLLMIEKEKNRSLSEIEALRDEKKRLQTELGKEKEESSLSKSQLEKLSQLNFQVVEKKVEEMAEEFRKQFDDKYRILSRRIRVAEQLQVENKEWYRKTKESYEQQNKDLKNRAERNEIDLKNIKELTLAANDVLMSLDSVALNFEECSANFLNRISKASCELKFAKHWAMRKNKAVLHVKDEMDCLLAQLDDKEKEILVFREKVWKSENKVRELEKGMKEKEDAMLGLKEEKREAIRQLCVWIDYHRGRSDYYLKMLSEVNAVRK